MHQAVGAFAFALAFVLSCATQGGQSKCDSSEESGFVQLKKKDLSKVTMTNISLNGEDAIVCECSDHCSNASRVVCPAANHSGCDCNDNGMCECTPVEGHVVVPPVLLEARSLLNKRAATEVDIARGQIYVGAHQTAGTRGCQYCMCFGANAAMCGGTYLVKCGEKFMESAFHCGTSPLEMCSGGSRRRWDNLPSCSWGHVINSCSVDLMCDTPKECNFGESVGECMDEIQDTFVPDAAKKFMALIPSCSSPDDCKNKLLSSGEHILDGIGSSVESLLEPIMKEALDVGADAKKHVSNLFNAASQAAEAAVDTVDDITGSFRKTGDHACTWEKWDGYYIGNGHGASCDSGDYFSDLNEAKRQCFKAKDCTGIATQSNLCSGYYRITHGAAEWKQHDHWSRWNLWAYDYGPPGCVRDQGSVLDQIVFPLWYVTPTDCGAFSDIAGIFSNPTSAWSNFNSAGQSFIDCVQKPGIFGIPFPFLEVKTTSLSLPDPIQTAIQAIAGGLQQMFKAAGGLVSSASPGSVADSSSPLYGAMDGAAKLFGKIKTALKDNLGVNLGLLQTNLTAAEREAQEDLLLKSEIEKLCNFVDVMKDSSWKLGVAYMMMLSGFQVEFGFYFEGGCTGGSPSIDVQVSLGVQKELVNMNFASAKAGASPIIMFDPIQPPDKAFFKTQTQLSFSTTIDLSWIGIPFVGKVSPALPVSLQNPHDLPSRIEFRFPVAGGYLLQTHSDAQAALTAASEAATEAGLSESEVALAAISAMFQSLGDAKEDLQHEAHGMLPKLLKNGPRLHEAPSASLLQPETPFMMAAAAGADIQIYRCEL